MKEIAIPTPLSNSRMEMDSLDVRLVTVAITLESVTGAQLVRQWAYISIKG